MKKLFLLVLFAFTMCLPVWSQMRGDLNGDNQVDVSDVNIMIDMVLGKQAQDISVADLDGNNIIDVSDVNAIIDIVLGKDPSGGDEPGIQTFTVNGVSFKMVNVEGGSFTMGASDDDVAAYANEKPAHQVTLSGYSIGETEVTQELWQAVMGDNPSYFNGYGNSSYGSYHQSDDYGTDLQRPVEEVTWSLCQEFITKLNELTGRNFRLPTEAEWEFAARGGIKSQGYYYAGSNIIANVAWYANNAFYVGKGTGTVATKAPNELGLYDMSGNVSEWCQDWYGDYLDEAQTNPTGSASSAYYERVIRGGCWGRDASRCRVSFRESSPANSPIGVNTLGLRLAL